MADILSRIPPRQCPGRFRAPPTTAHRTRWRAPPPRRPPPPSGGPSGSRPTATSGSTTGTGCGTRTTRPSSPTSRPRTPTPRRSWRAPGRSRRGCSTRWWPGSRRPTSRSRSARGPGSTTAAPWREQLRHPLPPAGRRARGRRAGPPGRERAGRGPRLLLRRQPLGQPRPPLAGVLDRHHRRRALHHALPRPGDRRRGGRVHRGHLLRRGLGQRQRHRVLRPGRRGHAPLPAVASPGRDRPGRRRPGLRGARRPLLPGRGPDQGRPVRAVGLDSKVTSEVRALAADDPEGGSRSSSPGARASSTASTTTGATRRAGARVGSSSSPTTGPRTSG